MRFLSVRISKALRANLLLLSMAALGAAVGHLVTSRVASACECSTPTWKVRLQSATSSDPATNHQSFWPAEGRLSGYTGHASIWANTFTAGVIGRVGAGR
jgi:hypothetical protein